MKKLMFNDKYGLTKAVLEGRKTMTRRVVPECKALDILRHWEHNEGAIATGYEEHTHSFRSDYCPDKKRRTSIDHLNLIPFYKVGEIVAVVQAYEDLSYNIGTVEGAEKFNTLSKTAGWHNKMFVRADLMPHQIRITDVRVERLQDISDEECLKEGIYKDNPRPGFYFNGYAFDLSQDQYGNILAAAWFKTPREAFSALIDRVSGKGTWQSNPWVFVYEFELVK